MLHIFSFRRNIMGSGHRRGCCINFFPPWGQVRGTPPRARFFSGARAETPLSTSGQPKRPSLAFGFLFRETFAFSSAVLFRKLGLHKLFSVRKANIIQSDFCDSPPLIFCSRGQCYPLDISDGDFFLLAGSSPPFCSPSGTFHSFFPSFTKLSCDLSRFLFFLFCCWLFWRSFS